ncbi:stalk domain-containing protein [Caldalkalibacillus mannanilyticus]|uniref:stalk domain-containing protein n=1 Tax=Caldalkalibacillus mannanilyticus TaxID=1418 RepID=UPI00046AA88B|nr:stalk domain-containing protein [Caldalkalibacillus mannanilyticus]
MAAGTHSNDLYDNGFWVIPTGLEVKASGNNDPQRASSEWITAGAKLEKWNWKLKDGNVKINVIEVDLQHPYIKVDTLGGKDGMMGNRQTTTQLANERQAVAAINGDFFTMNAEGAPFGVHIQSGEMVTSPGYISPKNTFALDEEKTPFIGRFDFDAHVIAANGERFRLFGINKTQYQAGFRFEGNSHMNRLHMYTPKWNMKKWVGDSLKANYTVAVVENNVVKQIVENRKAVESIPEGSFLLLGHGEAETFLKENLKVGDTIQVDYSLNPDQNWWMAIDGSSLLVRDGKFINHATPGRTARTGIGYSKDLRYMYMVTAERSKESIGLTFAEFGRFLESRGLWEAVNLDGGGSTAMATRPLGHTQTTNIVTQNQGTERLIPNGIGIFTTAPAGKLLGWSLSVPKKVLVNEKASITVRAYDEYYNPMKGDGVPIEATSAGAFVWHNDQTFSLQRPGRHEIQLTVQGKTEKHTVSTYGMTEVRELKITTDALRLGVGEAVQAKAVIQMTDGSKRNVSPNSLQWQLVGFKGSVSQDGTVKADQASAGVLIASYQGFSTAVPVIAGQTDYRVVDNFQSAGKYAVVGHKGTETGSFAVTEDNGSQVGTFTYNFGESDDIRIVYLRYGSIGMGVSGQPSTLSLRVKGDNSGHWLRTEFKDAKGEVHRVDLAEKVDWEGWKTLTVSLPKMAYPVALNSIYVVHLESSKDSSPLQGQLSFADLRMQDWQTVKLDKSKKNLVFTLDKREVLVNQKKVTLDQAPILVEGRTLLPLRHLSELIGGDVRYLEKERKVQVIENYRLHNFWLDHDFMSINGTRKKLDVKPMVRNGRTMLPLRAFAEAYGLYIHYDDKTKQITVQ